MSSLTVTVPDIMLLGADGTVGSQVVLADTRVITVGSQVVLADMWVIGGFPGSSSRHADHHSGFPGSSSRHAGHLALSSGLQAGQSWIWTMPLRTTLWIVIIDNPQLSNSDVTT